MAEPQKSVKATTASAKTSKVFSEEERDAMKERARELKASSRRGPRAEQEDGETLVLAKIAEMLEPDRVMAERLHTVILASVPDLAPRLWYGMPAYAKDGKMVCFFQTAQKFKTRYATLGFSDDEEPDWPDRCGHAGAAGGGQPSDASEPSARAPSRPAGRPTVGRRKERRQAGRGSLIVGHGPSSSGRWPGP